LTEPQAAIAGVLLTTAAILLALRTRNIVAIGVAAMFLVLAILNLLQH
jgi:hypothetical protein